MVKDLGYRTWRGSVGTKAGADFCGRSSAREENVGTRASTQSDAQEVTVWGL